MLKSPNYYFLVLVFAMTLMFTFQFCTNSRDSAPDVSHILAKATVVRSEIDIFSIDTTKTLTEIERLIAKDSSFYEIYFNYVLRVPLERLSPEEKVKFLNGFIADKRIQKIGHEVDSVYGSFEAERLRFEKAFQYMKYYFPEKKEPILYTFLSEFSLQRFLFEPTEEQEGLAIGLDLFLGSDYNYAKYDPSNEHFSAYLTRRYDRDHIVKRSLEAMVEDWLGASNIGETLLDKMIYNGKKLYILSKLLPDTEDNIIMGYTDDQLLWCQENELEMWSYFFKEELFYSTDINKITKLVSPSPHSTGMPPQAPGRTANYVGWQIVKAFMKKQPDMDLQDLINFGESQKILEISKFKPKRK